MKQKIERVIRNKKLLIGLAELAVVVGIIAIFCLLMIPKDRVPNRTHSYSKEEVTEYEIVDKFIECFKIILEKINNEEKLVNEEIKVFEIVYREMILKFSLH